MESCLFSSSNFKSLTSFQLCRSTFISTWENSIIVYFCVRPFFKLDLFIFDILLLFIEINCIINIVDSYWFGICVEWLLIKFLYGALCLFSYKPLWRSFPGKWAWTLRTSKFLKCFFIIYFWAICIIIWISRVCTHGMTF